MNKTMKKIIPIIIALFIAVSGAFYGGMKYAQNKNSYESTQGGVENFRNLSPEEREQRFQELGANLGGAFAGARKGNMAGTNSVTGEIIVKDEQSITIKLPDGGTRIIFFSESTNIMKPSEGSGNDLKEGEQVVVNGKENSDGSYTAEMINIRDNKLLSE